jgi:hypothetical protein
LVNGSNRKRLSPGRSTMCRIVVALRLGWAEEPSASAKGDAPTTTPAATRIGMRDWQLNRNFQMTGPNPSARRS